MLGCTGNAEPHPAPARDPRSEGGTLLQSHPPLHHLRCSHAAAPSPAAAPMMMRHQPDFPNYSTLAAPAPSTQHPSPGPGFLGVQPPRGMPAVRVSSVALGSYANLGFLCGEQPAQRGCLRDSAGVRAPSCTPALLAALLGTRLPTGAQLGNEGLEPHTHPVEQCKA